MAMAEMRISMRSSRLLASCAVAASLVALGRAVPAQAQAFQGSATVTSGSVSITRGTGVDTIDVASPQAVIDWAPEDVTSATIDYLPAGNQAQYVGAPGLPNFTVLNRIIPASPSQVIAFNGSVISRLQDSLGNQTPGGAVWFYTPGGLLVGATATFDVGALLLTTADPVRDTFGNFQFGNNSQFRAIPGSTSAITIAPGARIDALPADSYLALVAPRITQSGTATVNGGVAYVAAEAVDLTINRGLFDINVVTGTADSGNVLVHDGITTGPAGDGLTDPARIYMVAVPQNQAITMLLSGRAGFDPATVAGVENGIVVLSAGRSVFFDQPNALPQGTADADIRITGGDFTSRVVADSTGSTKAGSETANLNFGADVTLSASHTAELRAFAGSSLTVAGNALIRSSLGDRTAGTAAIIAEAGATLSIAQDANVIADGGDDFRPQILPGDIGRGGIARIISMGDIQIGGRAAVSAEGRGRIGFGTDGFQGIGGDAAILAQGGGRIGIALDALVLGDGLGGGSDSGASGDALGGIATIASDNGTIDIGGAATLIAVGSTLSGVTAGGSGIGGRATLTANNGGTIRVVNDIVLDSTGRGAFASGAGGAATGGIAEIRTSSGGSIAALSGLTADASGFSGSGISSGDARGGTATVALDNGALAVGNTLLLIARGGAPSNTGTGGKAFGGTISLSATSTTLDVTGNTQIEAGANGDSGATGGDAVAGSVSILSTGGILGMGGLLSINAGGIGGAGGSGSSGSGTGATVSILSNGDGVTNGAITGGDLNIFAYGDGGQALGPIGGGDGHGGNVTIATGAGSVGFGNGFIDLTGRGGTGGASDMVGGNGGMGTGGALTLGVAGGPLAFASLNSFVDGRGGGAGFGAMLGGAGGAGIGGNITITGTAGVMNFATIGGSARGEGGLGAYGGIGGAGGMGTGGTILIRADGAPLHVGDAIFGADGLGGDSSFAQTGAGGAGGDGFGGSIDIASRTGAGIDGTRLFVTNTGRGGFGGSGGNASTGGNGGAGGMGTGGLARIKGLLNFGDTQLGVYAFGGMGGIGGNGADPGNSGGLGGIGGSAIGGIAEVLAFDGDMMLGRFYADAFAAGGQGGGGGFGAPDTFGVSIGAGGGAGGNGTGGLVRLLAGNDPSNPSIPTSGNFTAISANLSAGGDGGGSFNADGGDGRGGTAAIVGNGGTISIAEAGSINARAHGGFGNVGGDALGGSATITLTGGALNFGAIRFLEAGAWGGDGNVAGTSTGGNARIDLSAGTITATEDLILLASATGGYSPGIAGAASGGAALVKATGGSLSARSLSVEAAAFGGEGTVSLPPPTNPPTNPPATTPPPRSPSARGGDATGGIAGIEATGGSIAVSQQINVSTFAHGGAGSTIAGGDARGGASTILVAPGGTLNSGMTHVSAFASGGSASGVGGVGGKGNAGSASLSITGGMANLGSASIDTFGIGGQGGDGASGGAGIGGSSVLTISGGVINAADIYLTGAAAGGGGGIGGNGANAIAGSARATISGGQVTTGFLNLSVQANGGFGGNGTPGSIGGRGGDAAGGQALLAISGDAQVDAGNAMLATGAFGGMGGLGGDGSNGGAGGNGGAATGGVSILTASGGSLVAMNATIDAVAYGGDGGFGGAGTTAGNSGGAGGNGSTGAAGTVKVEAAGGALSFGTLSLIASGTGGKGGRGGDGAINPDGSINTAVAGMAGAGSGGTLTIRTADNGTTGSVGKLQSGNTYVSAGGFGGFDPSGGQPVDGFAGRLLVAAEGTAPGGSLGFASLIGDARGLVTGTAPVLDLHSDSQIVTVGQTVDLFVDGDALIQTGIGAQFRALDFNIVAGGSIAVNSLDTLIAIDASNLLLSAGRDIMLSPTALLHATNGLQAYALGSVTVNRVISDGLLRLDGDTVTVTNASAGGDIDLHAVNLLSAGTVNAGGNAFLGSSAGGVIVGNVSAATDIFFDSGTDTRFTSIAASGDVGIATIGGGIFGGTIGGTNVVLLAANGVDAGAVRADALYIANASMLGSSTPVGTLADFLLLAPVATGGSIRFTGAVDVDRLILNSGGSLSFGSFAASTDIALTTAAGDLTLGVLTATGSISLAANGGNLTTGALTSDLDVLLFTAGALSTGDIAATGNIDLNAGSALMAGNISGADVLLTAGGPLDLGSLKATGLASLNSAAGLTANGALDVAGPFNVTGATVSIDAAGPLRIDSVAATIGAASIQSNGDLDIANADAATDLILVSRTGALRSGSLVAGGDLNIIAAGLATLNGATSASTITVASSDMAIASAANIAATSSLSFDAGGPLVTIGGTGSVSGYSLDAAEFARISTPKLSIASNADITLLDLTLLGSAATTPILTGPSASFRVQTSGAINVTGKLLLANAGTTDRIELAATDRLTVTTPSGGIAIRAANGDLAGTLSLQSNNVVIASDAAAVDLAAASALAVRKERLATNDGTASSVGYLEANAISLIAGSTLYVQNSGTDADPAGLTVGAGGLTVSSTNSGTEMILYGRGANADGSFVTGEAFIPTVTRSSGFDAGSTINGCFLVGPCLGAPPEPAQQAIAATVDTVIAVIASAQESDSGSGGGGGGGGAPSSSQAITRAPNIVLGELLDFTPFKMQRPVEGPVTGAGNDDPGSAGPL
jgi:hypothetical protein